MSLLSLGALLWLLQPLGAQATFAAQNAANSIDTSLVQINADQQTYDSIKSKTFLKGNVQVTYKEIRIKGSEATMDVDATGNPTIAHFFKRPLAKRIIPFKGEDTLQGDIIHIFLRENAMTAEGNTVTYVNTVASDPFTIRADTQQFDNTTKNVVARGAVVVNYKETKAFSPRAILQVGADGKAEKVVFSGGARIEKENSQILGEKVTVMMGSGNMIAEQNVKTQVDLKDPKGGVPTRVLIDSDYQQYDKASETVLASGNVKIIYDTYVATGPKATFKMKDGGVDQIFLTGRPSIVENDRTIIADKITITTTPKHFDAYGHVKTQFQAQKNGEPITADSGEPATSATAKPGGKTGKTPPGKKPGSKPKSSLPQTEPDLIEE